VRFFLILVILVSFASSATAGCWELPVEVAVTPGVAVISPAGTAPTLEAQGLTIFLQVFDCVGEPLPNFPAEDIWVSDPGLGEVWMCRGGSVADANTDALGNTTISGAIYGGGYTTGGTQVYLSGMPVGPAGPLPLEFISADYDGNLVVNLVDFVTFAADFGQHGIVRSDFDTNGRIDLTDFAAFGVYFGDVCP
jgi:hypothetical protein